MSCCDDFSEVYIMSFSLGLQLQGSEKKNNYSSKSKNSTSKMGVKNETLVYQAAAEHFHKKNSGSSIVSPQVKYKILKTVNLSRI